MSERIIIKAIEDTCQSGRRAWDVYEDWLDIVLAAPEAMPRHAASIAATRRPAEDTPEVQDLYARLRATYAHADFERFATAFHALTDEAQQRGWGGHGETWDIMGSVYMQLNVWSGHSGQYFTPWSIAEFMARMSLGDVETDIRRRIAEAIDRGPWGVMGLANGASITQPGKEQIMLQALAQNYAHLEPLTVCDPACGSGVTLLAAASVCPRWAIDYNVVRFFGQDIDRTCVKMARVNMMLYGLNGYGLRLNAALHAPPAELVTAVTLAKPDQDAPPEPTITLPSGRAEQGSLFV